MFNWNIKESPILSLFGMGGGVGSNLVGGSVFGASGGTVTTSGDYTYHTFPAPGTFTVVGSGPVEMAVIGGGGGGGGAKGSNGPDKGSPGGSGGGAVVEHILTEGDYSISIGGGGTQGNSTTSIVPDSPPTFMSGGPGGTPGGGQGAGGSHNMGAGGGGGGFSSVVGGGVYYAVGGGGAGGGGNPGNSAYGGGNPNNNYIPNSTTGQSGPQVPSGTPTVGNYQPGGGGGGYNGSGGGGGVITPNGSSTSSGGSNYSIPTAISSTLYAGVSSGAESDITGAPGAPGILSSPNWSPVMTTGVGAYGPARYPGAGSAGRVSIRFLTSQLTG